MTPAMTDCEARALVQWIGPSSETRPKYASDIERAATAHRSVYCLACTRRRAAHSTAREHFDESFVMRVPPRFLTSPRSRCSSRSPRRPARAEVLRGD